MARTSNQTASVAEDVTAHGADKSFEKEMKKTSFKYMVRFYSTFFPSSSSQNLVISFIINIQFIATSKETADSMIPSNE